VRAWNSQDQIAALFVAEACLGGGLGRIDRKHLRGAVEQDTSLEDGADVVADHFFGKHAEFFGEVAGQDDDPTLFVGDAQPHARELHRVAQQFVLEDSSFKTHGSLQLKELGRCAALRSHPLSPRWRAVGAHQSSV
jgi:hypothetical protein